MVEVRYTQEGTVKRIIMLNLTVEQFCRHNQHCVIDNYEAILQLLCKSPLLYRHL
jgi:hypothetical protein